MRRTDRIVVVGAGTAGLRAAERLRELGFDGELVLVGAEEVQPYHRPALTKQFLTGDLRARDITMPTYVDLDAQWRLGNPVHRLDTGQRLLHMYGEQPLHYDGLVIATGLRARPLPGAPDRDPRVQVVRTVADAANLQRWVTAGDGPIAVIGGGFTACELASTFREMGRDVILVSRSPVLLGAAVGPELGGAVTRLHAAKGVSLLLNEQVRHWVPGDWGMGMQLTNGKFQLADCVAVAVGGVPETDWLHGSGLDISDGVLCGPTGHAVGAADVVAAGDVARWPNHRFGRTPRRIEHWINAVEMGRAAAENLLAGHDSARPFAPVPRFWTEQFGMRLQFAGMPGLGTSTTALTDGAPDRAGVLGYLADGELVGVAARDSPRAVQYWTDELHRRGRLRQRATMTIRTTTKALLRKARWAGWQQRRADVAARHRPGRRRQPEILNLAAGPVPAQQAWPGRRSRRIR